MDEVILVDLDDQEIGRAEKIFAHETGLLHRAFSVFLFCGDSLILQKRASTKYRCGGLWTNTCCSHPRAGESVAEAAQRRLREEIGIEVKALQAVASFVYRFPFSNGLTEFEYDHILIGEYHGEWIANPEEVDAVKYMSIPDLKTDIVRQPETYTPWFITALEYAINGRK